MLNKAIKKIHRFRVGFLILISIAFLAYLGLNPLDLSRYYGARFGSAVGMSMSIPENPVNKLALELSNKEKSLADREADLRKREEGLAKQPNNDRLVMILLGAGIILLFVLIIINFYLDRRYRRKEHKS